MLIIAPLFAPRFFFRTFLGRFFDTPTFFASKILVRALRFVVRRRSGRGERRFFCFFFGGGGVRARAFYNAAPPRPPRPR
jgi:hypothetical protein